MNIKGILNDDVKLAEFIKENESLIIKVIKDTYPSILTSDEFEDYMQIGRFGLYRAMKEYDENRGASFSTFAYIYIKSRIIHKIKCDSNKIYQGKKNVCSLNVKAAKNNDEIDEVIDLLKSNENIENKIIRKETAKENRELFLRIYNSIPKSYQYILREMLKGKTQADIARQLGCSRENIRQKFEKIKKMALLIRKPGVRASDGLPYIAV